MKAKKASSLIAVISLLSYFSIKRIDMSTVRKVESQGKIESSNISIVPGSKDQADSICLPILFPKSAQTIIFPNCKVSNLTRIQLAADFLI